MMVFVLVGILSEIYCINIQLKMYISLFEMMKIYSKRSCDRFARFFTGSISCVIL